MPNYEWSCLACGNANQSGMSSCKFCGCNASASMKKIIDFRQDYVSKCGAILPGAARLPNNEGKEITFTNSRPASQGHSMDPRHTIPFFIIWVLVLAALCYGFSYDSSSALYSGPLLFCILVFRNKESYTRKMSAKGKWISIGIAAIVVALIVGSG